MFFSNHKMSSNSLACAKMYGGATKMSSKKMSGRVRLLACSVLCGSGPGSAGAPTAKTPKKRKVFLREMKTVQISFI